MSSYVNNLFFQENLYVKCRIVEIKQSNIRISLYIANYICPEHIVNTNVRTTSLAEPTIYMVDSQYRTYYTVDYRLLIVKNCTFSVCSNVQ
jgi:hypothetical protein